MADVLQPSLRLFLRTVWLCTFAVSFLCTTASPEHRGLLSAGISFPEFIRALLVTSVAVWFYEVLPSACRDPPCLRSSGQPEADLPSRAGKG